MVEEGQRKTLVILDLDDTLHPTTAWQAGEALSHRVVAPTAAQLLKATRGAHQRIVVTNATPEWAQACTRRLAQQGVDLAGIEIISARQLSGAEDWRQWKRDAFREIAANLGDVEQVVCVGDLDEDHEAAREAFELLPGVLLKLVCFVPKPSAQALSAQQSLLARRWHDVLAAEHQSVVRLVPRATAA